MTKGAKWPRLSGNSLKEIEYKKKKNPCGRQKGCGRGRDTTNFFSWPKVKNKTLLDL
jgi:hypothetical protein